MSGAYSVMKPSSPVAICSWPRIGQSAMDPQLLRSARMRPDDECRARPHRVATRRSCGRARPCSVTNPEPKLMTSVRPLASLWRIAASTRSARASPTNGALPLALAFAVALTVPWYSTCGVRPAVSVLIGRLRASACAFHPVSFHAPSPHSCATLPCRHSEPSLKACALAITGTGASSLQVDVGGVVDEEIGDGRVPDIVDEAALAGQMQAGLAGERVDLELRDRRWCRRARR